MKAKKIMVLTLTAAMLAMAGCGKKEEAVDPTPTPAPTEAPTEAPTQTPTPMPSMKAVGEKTATSKVVEIDNTTGKQIKELYIRTAGSQEWGENLMAAEAVIEPEEKMQLNYEKAGQEDATYDLKWVDQDGTSYEITYLKLDDMSKAGLMLEEGTAYLKYQSLAEKKEVDSRDVTAQFTAQSDQAVETSGEATTGGTDTSGGNSGASYGDESYGGTSYDDSSYDDGSYDDGSGDTGSTGGGAGSDENYDDGGSDGAGGDAGCADGGDAGCGDTGGDIVVDENGNWSVQ